MDTPTNAIKKARSAILLSTLLEMMSVIRVNSPNKPVRGIEVRKSLSSIEVSVYVRLQGGFRQMI